MADPVRPGPGKLVLVVIVLPEALLLVLPLPDQGIYFSSKAFIRSSMDILVGESSPEESLLDEVDEVFSVLKWSLILPPPPLPTVISCFVTIFVLLTDLLSLWLMNISLVVTSILESVLLARIRFGT